MTTYRSNAVVSSTVDHEATRAAECEGVVLGALLRDSVVAWPLVKDVVNASHFSRVDHRMIFAALAALMTRENRADPYLAINELGDQLEAVGGSEYIATLYENQLTAANADAYARILRDYANRTKVVDITSGVAARTRLGGSAADAIEEARRQLDEIDLGQTAKPLATPMVAEWAGRPEPQPREWVLDGLIPAAKVSSLLGNGGLGKTLLALQIGLHVSLGRPLFDVKVSGGPVLGIFCEDDEDELNRRLRSACAAERVDIGDVDRFAAISREGQDSILCTFERDHMRTTPFYSRLEAAVASFKPQLLMLDTAADLFAGDFLNPAQVRQFLKVALGGLCVRYGCAVLLLAHPSKAGQASGDGDGFSTQWHNSVRSRLYLSKPKAPDAPPEEEPADVSDRRVLTAMKANYAPDGTQIPLVWDRGCFVLDQDPVEATPRAARIKTGKLAGAAYDVIRGNEPAVTSFRMLFDDLQRRGEISQGDYDKLRKPLQRAIKQLVDSGQVHDNTMPRGYRIVGGK